MLACVAFPEFHCNPNWLHIPSVAEGDVLASANPLMEMSRMAGLGSVLLLSLPQLASHPENE
jgi:hypothetical protein